MSTQICIDDLLKAEEPPKKTEIPVSRYEGERVYTIPADVWEKRCRFCVHRNAAENIPIPSWAVYRSQYSEVIPCRIMALSKPNEKQGECMSFAPRISTYGICESCRNNNIFFDGFCTKADHAAQRRVCFGTDYGGDERKVDYYARHRLSVCDDYRPDYYADENERIE